MNVETNLIMAIKYNLVKVVFYVKKSNQFFLI